MEGANVDIIHKGEAYGNIAKRLMDANFNVNALRTNDLLRKDEWKLLDTKVVETAQKRLVVVGDMINRGLTYNVPNAMGKTILEYQTVSDITAAGISMDGLVRGRSDRPDFSIAGLPLPIIHKDFNLSARELAVGRNGGMPLDVMQVGMATRKVAEFTEDMTINGLDSTFKFGGYQIYGFKNAPNRNTGTIATPWDDSSITGKKVINDVMEMMQALIDLGFYGPYGLYIPSAYQLTMSEDYTTGYPGTIEERLMKIKQLAFVKVADSLDTNNVILYQLDEDTARVVVGFQPQVVQWETDGGMNINFKVMSIIVPDMRSDYDSACGIAHWSE